MPQPHHPLEVLSVGLGRTGSYSMALALRQLGYANVFHCVDAIDAPDTWAALDRAADATFPSLPSYTGVPFTRAQWDAIFGGCDAVTDAAGPFALALIAAYPEARVVLVHRDFDAWWSSVERTLLPYMWGPMPDFFARFIEPLAGSSLVVTGRKMLLGWAGARDLVEFKAQAREAFDRHEAEIRAMVPPVQLLYYRMGDGWGPLCRFLARDVPGGPFPRANEQAVMTQRMKEKQIRLVKGAIAKAAPYLVAGLALLCVSRYFSTESLRWSLSQTSK